MVDVAIVGVGPWGLCALERFINQARLSPATSVHLHVVEPGRPGGGIFSQDDPDYLVLNTPCGQHSMYPYPDQVEPGRLGMGFFEWATKKGYRWQGTDCVSSETGEPLGPVDFLPRRLMGEYLEWFYGALVAEVPANMAVFDHRTAAVDIEPTTDGRECVHLANGDSIVVDQVVLTAGHLQEVSAAAPVGSRFTPPYPVEPYIASTKPGDKVAIEGMGLVALDVITAFTIGLGGSYTSEPDGTLRYHPSGREPSLFAFSLSGYPLCAKSIGTADPVGDYEPAICTVAAISALKRGADGGKRQMDARTELLPLVFAEMELCYYARAARTLGGEEAGAQAWRDLTAAWATGHFAAERARYAATYGSFNAERHFFVGDYTDYRDSADYESQVYASVASDVEAAMVPGGASPLKAALETLRALRDTLRLAVEFKGLTLASQIDFQTNLRGRLASLVAGPPAFRSQQLLALIDAGILRLPFGPSPEVRATADGRVTVRSTRLVKPFSLSVDRLVRAHLDVPSVSRPKSALLANLARRGRVRPLMFDGTPVGSIDLTEDFHPLRADGSPEGRLWVFGVVTEGVRYFTLYVPSPKSRVRAFVDAEICAKEVLRLDRAALGAAPVAAHEPGPYGAAALTAAGERLRGDDAGSGGRLHVVPQTATGVAARRTLRVALVNNMPDGAFAETERQFLTLLGAQAAGSEVVIDRFTLPGVPRGAEAQALISDGYRDLEDLWTSPPDALVVTGAEPKRADLTEELYWPALEELLWWARSAVPSVLASCLSAHAAAWVFDALPRRLLPQKCSGVYDQVIDHGHPLMSGIGAVALPHSRFNEIAETDMAGAGYQVVARCEGTGWTVAAAERGQCQLVLLQGHPEYTPHQLLREYRRDVRRWLAGAQGSYPHIPEGYLDDQGVGVLAEFEREVTAKPRDPGAMGHFPFDAAAGHIRAPWLVASRVLMANWMRYVRERHDAAAAPVSTLPVTPPPAVLADVGADQGLEPGGLPGA